MIKLSYVLRPAKLLRVAGPFAFGLLCLYLLRDQLSAVDLSAVRTAILGVSPLQWLAALGATGVSFWALGRYDVVIHRHLNTGIAGRDALRSGAASIALAQVLGMGVVTGALARWRMLPGLSPIDAARVSASVALSFMFGWAVVAAAADLALPLNVLPGGAAVAILCGGAAFAITAFFTPRLRVMGRVFQFLLNS